MACLNGAMGKGRKTLVLVIAKLGIKINHKVVMRLMKEENQSKSKEIQIV